LIKAPKAQINTSSGATELIRARPSSEFTDAGWKTSSPSSRAACATGGG
jgi:hypothetical protein